MVIAMKTKANIIVPDRVVSPDLQVVFIGLRQRRLRSDGGMSVSERYRIRVRNKQRIQDSNNIQTF